MPIKKPVFLIPLFIFLFLSPALLTAEDLDKIVEGLQHKYEKISTIEADFAQEAFTKSLNKSQTSEGKVYFKKPGKMKWLYRKPVNDEIVSDGKTIWVFQSDLNQVIEKQVEGGASNLAVDFLSGIGDIKKGFDIEPPAVVKGAYRLSLKPKTPQPNVKRIIIEVDKESFLVEKTIVEDLFGNEARVTLKDIKANTPLKDSIFEFTPPKGSSIVRP